MTVFEDVVRDESRYHVGVYRRQPVAFVRGEGTRLIASDGRSYLDFVAGIAVAALGHSHPAYVEAVREQVGRLTHVSNLYYTLPQVALAKRLHELLGWGRVFFANSGAEANECALKLARRHASQSGRPRAKVVALLGSFHGRTLATLAATGQLHKHEPFRPLPPEFVHVPLNDIPALESAVDDATCAVLMEIVQGEGGVVPADAEFVAAARRLCDERGCVLIFDEVQTGLGRTGRFFAFEHLGITPDVITLAKALGGGLPIGACIAREDVAGAFAGGDHATTFGGGPVPCAAALAVLDVIEKEGLVANSMAMGDRLLEGLDRQAAGIEMVEEVRGLGLLVGIQLRVDRAADVVAAALDRGLLVNNATPSVIRLCPPLIVSPAEIDEAVTVLGSILKETAW